MASVKRVQHKSGRIVYRIVICLGYDNKGNKLVKNLTYSVNQTATPKQQEKEALKYALDMEDKLKYGYDFNAEKMSFEDFAEKWLENIKDDLAYSTYDCYRILLDKSILPYFKTYKLAHIKTPIVEAYYKTLVEDYSRGTIRKHANILSGMFRTAIRWGMIEVNPCQNARLPKTDEEEPKIKYFTPEQALMFLSSLYLEYETACKAYEKVDSMGITHHVGDYIKTVTVDTQYKLFYTLSVYCGFRKGETLALHWDDIDFEKREISITKSLGRAAEGNELKKPKTKTSIRKVTFPLQIVPLLKQYRTEYNLLRLRLGSAWKGNGNLFIRDDGELMGINTPYQFFTAHLNRYNRWVKENPTEAKLKGFEELPIIPLHGLRHSCATLLNSLDVNIIDISELLGHSQSSTTMNIYAHSFEKQKKKAANKLEEFLSKQA